VKVSRGGGQQGARAPKKMGLGILDWGLGCGGCWAGLSRVFS